MNEIQEIQVIAKKILAENTGQNHGTEWQKYTYAMLKARKIYHDEV